MPKHRRTGAKGLTGGLAAVGAGALVLHGWRLGIRLFGPVQPYLIDPGALHPIETEDFLEFLATITDSRVRAGSDIEVLTNGERFYPAEFEAARSARRSINLEAYGFLEGEVTRQFLDIFEERAKAGVQVRLIIDAIGSWRTRQRYVERLTKAGGHVTWYHPIDWKHWPEINHRSHRKLMTVDGRIGFVGGAGFADHWLLPNRQGPPWRDTVLRLEGAAAAGLNAIFAQNWLEQTGEVIAGSEHFPAIEKAAEARCLFVSSTPGEGATRARILFQTLIEGAKESIDITTPYFVPDRSARRALLRALRERGVRVRILVAGPHSDHPSTWRLGRAVASKLVKAGAEVYEYGPAMIHAKLMTVDGIWAVAGSTNFDHRSFALNDEVNIAVPDRAIAARLTEDFESDLARSSRLSSERLEHRSLAGRVVGEMSWILRREQ